MFRFARPLPVVLRAPAWALLPLCTAAPLSWGQPTQTPSTGEAEAQGVLPAVVVTGRKNPDQSTLTQPDLPAARAQLRHTPGGAGVVDAEQYTRGRVSTLSDALGTATGVFVQPRFGAEEARVSIRGSGLQRTFHGRGLQLMQDGVPLNLADGSFDFQAVEALSARYVEIWRGANALQYGAATLGGAINFVSPNGYNSDLARVRVEAGGFGYRRAQLSAGGVFGPVDLYVSTSAFIQDGFRRHAEQNTQRHFANLGWQLGHQLETRFYLGVVDSDSELPGSITRAQLRTDGRQAAAGNVTQDQRRDIDWTRVSNKTAWRQGAQQAELFWFASSKELHHPIFQVIDQDSEDRGVALRYRNESPLGGRGNRFSMGLSAQRGATDDERRANVNGTAGARLNAFRQTARNLAFHAENEHRVTPELGVVLGVQSLRSTRRSQDRLITGGVDEGFDLRFHATSPKLGMLYDISPRVQWFANVSRSAEPPSFSELTGGLSPTFNRIQKGTTYEVGTRGQTVRDGGWKLNWDVAFYEALLRDELLGVSTAPSVTTTINAPRTRHRGLELGLDGQAPGGIEWRLHALANDFHLRDHALYGDNTLPGLPKFSARAQLGWRLPQGPAGGTLLAATLETASGYPIDFANTFRAQRYAIWGLKAAGALSSSVSWFVEGRNLGDRAYASATGIVKDAAGRDQAQFLPGDGRAFYAGIDWRFNR